MIRQIEEVTVEHVRREKNKEADRLANEAMDRRADLPEGCSNGLLG